MRKGGIVCALAIAMVFGAAFAAVPANVRAGAPHIVEGYVGPVDPSPANPANSGSAVLYMVEDPAAPILTANYNVSDGIDPARFDFDVGSVWDPVIGNTVVGVIEVVDGINGWTGPNYTVSTDMVMTVNFLDTLPDSSLELMPTLTVSQGIDWVNVSWTGLADLAGNVQDYTVYNVTGVVGTSTPHVSGGAVWFNHTSLAPATYCYQIGVNYVRDAVGGIYTGNARSDQVCSLIVPVNPPYITSTDPVDGAVGVPLAQDIVVTFSEPMNTGSVTWNLNPPDATLLGVWSGGDMTLTLTHAAEPFIENTLYTVTITGQDVDEGLSLVPDLVPNPWSFTTIGQNPTIVTTTPTDSAINVPLNADIVVDFSEPMNVGTVAWTINPTVTLAYAWTNGDATLTLSHAVDFTENTVYTVEIITGEDLAGNPLAAGPVPNPWSFTTIGIPPTIVTTAPTDGQSNVPTAADIVVTFSEGMDTASVTWNIVPTVAVLSSWAGNTELTLSHLADPFVECQTYSVTIDGQDLAGVPLGPGAVPNPWSFTTVCPEPYIVSTDPVDGAAGVPMTSVIVVTFSETMNTATLAINIDPPTTYTTSWNSPTNDVLTITPDNPLVPLTTYNVTVSCEDLDANPLIPGPVPNPWSFTTEAGNAAPTVTVTAPAGGESWSGSSSHDITFDLADDGGAENLTVYVNYSYSAGAQTGTIVAGATGYGASNTEPWTVPCFDATDVIIEVTAVDALGASGSDTSLAFEVDCTAPTIASVTPSDGATSIALTDDIRVVFDEPMNTTTTEAAFSISPAVTGVIIAFDPTGSVMIVSQGGLDPDTTYTVTVASTATDDSDPGNPMAAPYTFSFTTIALVPQPPTGLVPSDITEDSLTLSWTAPGFYTTGDAIPAIVTITYDVYRATTPGGTGVLVGTVTDTTITDTGLDPETTYYYTVTARADGQASAASGELSVTTKAIPSVPVDWTPWIALLIILAVIVLLVIVLLSRRRPGAAVPVEEEVVPAREEPVAEEEEEEMLMCPRCGATVTATATACPSCGALFESEGGAAVAAEGAVEEVPAEEEVAEEPAAEEAEEVAEEEPEEVAEGEGEEVAAGGVACPKCGTLQSEGATECFMCGTSL
jgi:ribosomal protein L40E